jgi:heavy metal sensor kinase
MIQARSLRFRMMLLFCTVVGVLLAGSYLAFFAVLTREVLAQLDRQLLQAANPVVADLITDPNEEDLKELNIPDVYFELLDSSGRVLMQSMNFPGRSLDFGGAAPVASPPVFRTFENRDYGRMRLVLVPFQRGHAQRILAVAMPTRASDQVLETFRRIILVLFPASLLLTALVSAWYVSRSLRPVAELTQHAAEMTRRVADSESRNLWAPLRVANPHDELGRLAETFNQLLARVDAALRQLRQFVSDASHELRTPLSVLQGETELLLSEPRSTQDYEKTLQVIDGELKRLSRIVDGLFTLSMADAGELRLAREPLYLNEVLEEACELAAPLAQARGIVIEREVAQEVPYTGDEAFLRQLFLIFLDNAVKYSPSNTRVRVKLRAEDGKLRAQFQDQGIGISPEHLPRIFERFYRAAPPGSVEAHSGGLGLAIAQAIVRAEGGSIECVSEVGKGSTFTVNLPLPPQESSSRPSS